jgi:hypothetical protein
VSHASGRILNAWRQGCQVDGQYALSMGWIKPEEAGDLLLVITHDCDLQSTAEAEVELIRAAFVDQISGNNTHGKNPRVLHIRQALGSERALEITHNNRLRVKKEDLLGSNPSGTLSDSERIQLSKWLAYRYNRAPFPENFYNRLKKARTVPVSKLESKDVSRINKGASLSKQIDSVFFVDGDPIEGVYFALAGKESTELDKKEDYFLVVVVVAKSRQAAEENACLALASHVANKIKGLFENASWDDSQGKIVLEVCQSSTEKDFPLYNFNRMLRWHLDWLSGGES